MSKQWVVFCVLILGVLVLRGRAVELRLAPLFSDHAVLQRDAPLPVWGWAPTGATVRVALDEQSRETRAADDGSWRVTFAPLAAEGRRFELRVESGKDSVIARDLCAGDVWLAGGQATMARSKPASVTDPDVRVFTVPLTYGVTPARSLRRGSWDRLDKDHSGSVSVLATTFARRLKAKVNVPVGVIVAAQSAAPIGSWMNREAYELYPGRFLGPGAEERAVLEAALTKWTQRRTLYENAAARYRRELQAMGRPTHDKRLIDLLKPYEKEIDRQVPWSDEDQRNVHAVIASQACLYHGMIAPLIPYRIRGAIWHSGAWESEVYPQDHFYRLAPLIQGWRQAWAQGDFPFLFVQFQGAKAGEVDATPGNAGLYTGVREAQRLALQLPATGMAVIFDQCQGEVLTDVSIPAERLALLASDAVAPTAGRAASGPVYESTTIEGDRLRLRFRYADSGLVLAPPLPSVNSFVLGDRDGAWYPARVAIEGSDLVVWHPDAEDPVHVRYAWGSSPMPALFNEEGLPAAVFATHVRLTADFAKAREALRARTQVPVGEAPRQE